MSGNATVSPGFLLPPGATFGVNGTNSSPPLPPPPPPPPPLLQPPIADVIIGGRSNVVSIQEKAHIDVVNIAHPQDCCLTSPPQSPAACQTQGQSSSVPLAISSNSKLSASEWNEVLWTDAWLPDVLCLADVHLCLAGHGRRAPLSNHHRRCHRRDMLPGLHYLSITISALQDPPGKHRFTRSSRSRTGSTLQPNRPQQYCRPQMQAARCLCGTDVATARAVDPRLPTRELTVCVLRAAARAFAGLPERNH